MWFWRFPLRTLLRILIGGLLAISLHSCQLDVPHTPSAPQESSQAIASDAQDPSASAEDLSPDVALDAPPETSPETSPVTPPEISPEIQEILANAGTDELYNPPRGDVRLVVISDLNGAYGATDYDPEIDQAMTLMPFWNPDMVLCSGDMVAGQNPTLTQEQLQAMWMAFDDHVAAPLRQANLPYGFTMGNHDASGAQGGSGEFLFERERAVAADYWNSPEHNPGLEFIDDFDFPFYYTFRFGDVFFLAWDGSSFKIPPEKLEWVEQALSSPAAQSAKMKILIGHLPLYAVAVGRDKPGEVMANADDLRTMLERHNVHTYISGHQHAYYPGHKGQLQLLHMGILGSGPRAYIGSQQPSQKSLTVMDIRFDTPELSTYTTYDMQTLDLIQFDQLPRFIQGHNGLVLRRDVEMDDLSPPS